MLAAGFQAGNGVFRRSHFLGHRFLGETGLGAGRQHFMGPGILLGQAVVNFFELLLKACKITILAQVYHDKKFKYGISSTLIS
jgi:hypothetical protein